MAHTVHVDEMLAGMAPEEMDGWIEEYRLLDERDPHERIRQTMAIIGAAWCNCKAEVFDLDHYERQAKPMTPEEQVAQLRAAKG